jgi:hypothetical protein
VLFEQREYTAEIQPPLPEMVNEAGSQKTEAVP